MLELRREIPIPIYKGKLLIIFGSDSNKIFKRLTGQERDRNSVAVTFVYNGNLAMIFAAKHVTPGSIAHEALHVINMTWERIGHNPSISNDEPDTYFIEWLVNEIHKIHDEFQKKCSRKRINTRNRRRRTAVP